MKKLYSILPVLAVLFFFNSASAQLVTNNPYGISNLDWNLKYVNKTNLLLETVDQESFINYVVISSGGAWADMPYFTAYIKETLAKEKEELCYKVGSGLITDVAQVKAHLSSLQKGHAVLYAEYKTKKAEIVAAEDAKKVKRTGTGPVYSLACGSPCTNPGFESGTGVWDYWEGTACTAPDPCSLIPGFSASAHVLENVSGGFDPLVGPALPLVAPGGGSQSLMIGNGPVTGTGASRASISFTVDASSTNFTYRYAVVLQDPLSGHTDPQRPYFKVKLRDASGAVLACGDYEVIAKPPIVDFFLVTGTSDVYYRPWTTVFVPLAPYIGQCVTLEFTSSDCTLSGHYGYAYIDADCSPSTLLTSSPAVCGGASVTLTAPSGAATYQWTNVSTGGTIGIVGSSTSSTAVVDTGSTYQVVMTSVTGVACSSTLTITVLESPFSFFTDFSADTVCAGTPMTFLENSTPADSANAWAWDFNNDGLTDSNLENPTNIYAAGGTYPVTLISTWGPCNADTTINVVVLPGGIPVITTVPVMCSNGTNITLTQTGGPAGVWSGPGVIDSIAGTFDPSFADTLTANQITYTTPGMCGAADTISITVLPSANPAWAATAMCSDAALVDLTTLVTGTSGGTWSGTGVTGTNFNPTGLSGPVSVTYTVGTMPCVLTETHTFTVTPRADATITSALTLCSDDPAVSLTALQPGGTWSGTGGTTAGGTFNPAVGPGTYTVTYTIAGACGDVDTALVHVLLGGNPAWNLASGICQYDPCVDLATLVTGSTGGTFSGPGVTGTTFCPDSLSGLTNVTYTVGEGVCASSVTETINVDPIEAAFTASPTTGMDPLTVDFTNGSTNWNVLQWDLADGSGTTGVTNPSTTYTYGVYNVVLVATNSNGCTDTAYLTINVEQVSYLTIPNVFTPNGDGNNDIWEAIFQDGISTFHATIYDRWGLKLYEWSNPGAGWNGQAKNGRPAPDGTYFYIIDAVGVDKKEYKMTGYLQLLREK